MGKQQIGENYALVECIVLINLICQILTMLGTYIVNNICNLLLTMRKQPSQVTNFGSNCKPCFHAIPLALPEPQVGTKKREGTAPCRRYDASDGALIRRRCSLSSASGMSERYHGLEC
jgi:hypothetical protein